MASDYILVLEIIDAATLIYAIGAGITAAAGTRLALQWILVAGSPELGQDFEHVTVSSIRNKHDPGATVSATKVLRPSVSPPITGRL